MLAGIEQPEPPATSTDHRRLQLATDVARLPERKAAAVAAFVHALVSEPEADR
jgi:hypothetical protein